MPSWVRFFERPFKGENPPPFEPATPCRTLDEVLERTGRYIDQTWAALKPGIKESVLECIRRGWEED